MAITRERTYTIPVRDILIWELDRAGEDYDFDMIVDEKSVERALSTHEGGVFSWEKSKTGKARIGRIFYEGTFTDTRENCAGEIDRQESLTFEEYSALGSPRKLSVSDKVELG